MQEHIHGGHDGPEVIKDTIEKSDGALVFFQIIVFNQNL